MKYSRGPWHVQLHRKTTVRQDGKKISLRIDDHYNPTIGPLHVVDSGGRLIAAVAALDGVNEQAFNAALISRLPEIIDRCASLLSACGGDEAEELRTLLFRLTGDEKFR